MNAWLCLALMREANVFLNFRYTAIYGRGPVLRRGMVCLKPFFLNIVTLSHPYQMIKSDLFWSETHADRAPLFCNGLWPVLALHVGRCHVTISTSHDWRPIASTYKNHGWKIRFYGHLYFAGVRNLALKLYSNSIWIILKISCFTITEQRRSVTMGSWPTKSHLIILALVRERDNARKNMILSISFPAWAQGPSRRSRYT